MIDSAEFFAPTASSSVETEVKKSRFITVIAPVSSKAEFQSLYRNIQARFPNANHHCYAYIIGSPGSWEAGSSDDGEPSGTAGKPMLSVLQHNKLGNTAAVVTRIFGGIKLGTGGLVRAYSSAVKAGIEEASLKKQVLSHRVQASFPFRFENAVRHLLATLEISIVDARYAEGVIFEFDLPADLADDVQNRFNECTGGTGGITLPEPRD